MKTPEEIKKGLECCTPVWKGNHWKTCDVECPYAAEMVDCRTMLDHDALALIQQLQAENAEQAEKIRVLEARVQQLEAEQDDQISILRGAGCDACKYREVDSWEEPCLCCMNHERWEWIGAQKE